jgi:ribonuclease D
MFKPKITKEEVNQMPVVAFDGEITLVDHPSKVNAAIETLRESAVVGIDTETKPSFTRGMHHKVSLVQISSLGHCFLFRLNKMPFPDELAIFLADENVKKIGLALKDDFNGLIRQKKFKPANFVDLQAIAKNYGILELGLQKMFAIVFGRKISKSQRLTNWENAELTEQQQVYAATDAWASLLIYMQLMREKKLTKKQLDVLMANVAAEQVAHTGENSATAQ